MKAQALQYTVRGIPQEVDRTLRQRAQQRNISINQLIIEELTQATIGHRQVTDFSDLVGRWTSDATFDKILEDQREIHPGDWH